MSGTSHKVRRVGYDNFFKVLAFSTPPPRYLTKLERPTPGVAQKNLVTDPSTKISNVDSYMGNMGLPLWSESPKKLRDQNVVTHCPTLEQNSSSMPSLLLVHCHHRLPLLCWNFQLLGELHRGLCSCHHTHCHHSQFCHHHQYHLREHS